MKRIITLFICVFLAQGILSQVTETNDQAAEGITINSVSKLQKMRKSHLQGRYPFDHQRRLPMNRTNLTNEKSLDSLISREWDGNLSIWENSLREVFSYDANTNVAENVLSLWNSNTSDWQIFQKEEYSFDSNGYLIERVRSFQFVPGIWSLSEKTEYTYDGNGNEVLESRFSWDMGNSMWVNTYKNESTYDGNQNLILYQGFEWFPTTSQWINSFKDEYVYTNDILTSEINFLWNFGTSQWDNNTQWLFTYSAGQLIEEVVQDWDDNTSSWLNLNKYDFVYNPNGSLNNETLSIWDINGSVWDFFYKDEYQYDTNGNRTIGTYFEWADASGEWSEYYSDEYVFDLNFNLNDLILPYFYDESFDEYVVINNMLIGYFGYAYENMTWVNSANILFFYANYNNPLSTYEHVLSEGLSVYPNPTKDRLIIESDIPIDRVEVYSILGQKVVEANTSLDYIVFSELNNGIYLVKITAENQTVIKKVIKQ